MKNIGIATLLVAVLGVFTVFATPKIKEPKCATNCCKTEICKKKCVEAKCCKAEKTCDITDHKECKHKCCEANKETCHVNEEEKTCCKTK